jgi:hypothetical protein
MQPKSIHNPTCTENAPTQKPFPASGDNFTTVACLDGVTDPMALLTAIDFVTDCTVALAEFEQELEQEKDRTGTP